MAPPVIRSYYQSQQESPRNIVCPFDAAFLPSSPWNYRNSIWQLTTLKKPISISFDQYPLIIDAILFFFSSPFPPFDCFSLLSVAGEIARDVGRSYLKLKSIHAAALIASRVYNQTLIGCVNWKKKKKKKKRNGNKVASQVSLDELLWTAMQFYTAVFKEERKSNFESRIH